MGLGRRIFACTQAVIYTGSALVESNIVHPVTFGVAGQVSYFHKVFNIANGITKPKVLVCVGSDGIVRHT